MATGIMLTAFLGAATPITSAALPDTRMRPSTAATEPGRLMRALVSLPRVTDVGSEMIARDDAASVGCGAAAPSAPTASDSRTESMRIRRMAIPGCEGIDRPALV